MDRKFDVYIPPTMKMPTFKIIAIETPAETKQQAALWIYNRARQMREHAPLKRMPKGTTFKLIR